MTINILSSDECRRALNRCSPSAAMLDYHIGRFSEDINGFLGDYYLIKVSTDSQGTVNMFAKTLPVSYDLQMEYAISVGAFENEIFFYEILLSEITKYFGAFDLSIFPKYYYSRDDLVVLEDLTVEGYRLVDSEHSLDMDHIQMVLSTIAKYHCASLVYEEKKSAEYKRKYRISEEYSQFMQEPFFRDDPDFLGHKFSLVSQDCIETVIDMMPDMEISKDAFKREIRKAFEKCFETAKPSKAYRNVCCHGDLWKKNIMFKYKDGKVSRCKIIDFQLQKYNVPAYDVLKFLHQVTTTEYRQQHLDDILQYYHGCLLDELTAAGLPPHTLTRDEFQQSCKHVMLYVKIEASFYYSYQKGGPEFLKELMADNERFRAFTFVDRSAIAKDLYKTNPGFKYWMDEILYEIKDIIVHDGFSREDCRSVLRNRLGTTNYELVNYNMKPLDEKLGFLGEHLKLDAVVRRDGAEETLKFFLKRLPDSDLNAFTVSSGAFGNEKFMYADVFPEMERLGIAHTYDCVARCYFSRMNDALVFDDLNDAGYAALNKHKPFDYNTVVVVLKHLACFHSMSLIYEEKLSNFKIEHLFNDRLQLVSFSQNKDHISEPIIRALEKGVMTQIDMFPDASSKISDGEFKRRVLHIFNTVMYECSLPSKRYRNVTCHGDLWHNNILIKRQGGKAIKCKFVDFQATRVCPPAQDIMGFIYLCTSRSFRSKHLPQVLDVYYDELEMYLSKYGYDVKNFLPKNTFYESCAVYKTYATAQALSYFHMIMAKSEDIKDLLSNEKICHEMFYEDRSEFIKKLCDKDKQYKIMTSESIKDLRRLCENLDVFE